MGPSHEKPKKLILQTSHHAETKIPYRDLSVNDEIQSVIQREFLDKLTPERISSFFGLGDTRLSPLETEDFRLFVTYASKRLVNASLLHSFEGENVGRKEFVDRLRHKDFFGGIEFHDIAHTIAAYEDNKEDKTIVPPFFTVQSFVNNEAVIAHEPRALMWDSVFGDEPIFTALLDTKKTEGLTHAIVARFEKRKQVFQEKNDLVSLEIADFTIGGVKDILTKYEQGKFEETFKTYQTLIFEIVRGVNRTEYLREHRARSGLHKLQFQSIDSRYEVLTQNIIDNPDPNLIHVAKNVYDNYAQDPKILFHEFKRICGPLLETLKRRKAI